MAEFFKNHLGLKKFFTWQWGEKPWQETILLKIAILFTLFGIFWILVSDQILLFLVPREYLLVVSVSKGCFSFLLTGFFLYGVMHSALESLNISRKELEETYNATLLGWSRALSIRDHETSEHAQRVTDLTEKIARKMGIPEEEVIHIRRGALLHDVGKIGVPDKVLLKPGPLDDEEWKIMRYHPVLAKKLLSPVPYLQPAIDIPYCHHERWDGSGYPQGLKGEEIPLSARIFAVVDTWDALTNSRPYRSAWSPKKASEFLKEQSNVTFDPKVVEVFFQCVSSVDETDVK